MKKKKNFVIIITGGSKGLGKYLAGRFLEEGHNVNIIDIAKDNTLVTGGPSYYCADITNHEAIEIIFNDIYEKQGKIDVLINNAAKRYFSFLEESSMQDVSNTIEINLTANYITTREALKYMKKNGFGRIINISSNSGFKGYAKGSIYCATKAALNSFTEAVSKEIDKNLDITINSLCPGEIYSGGIPKGQNIGKGLILPESVFKIIYKLIHSNLGGAVVPVISFRTFLFHFFYQSKKFFQWLKYFAWRYL